VPDITRFALEITAEAEVVRAADIAPAETTETTEENER
jgi:hypothetical protein